MFVQGEGLGQEGRRPVKEVRVRLLHQEAVRPCCLVTVVMVELMQLMATHIFLCNYREVPGCKPKKALLLLTLLPCCDVHQLYGGIVQVAARICVQHVVTCQRPMGALGVCIRDDAREGMVQKGGGDVHRVGNLFPSAEVMSRCCVKAPVLANLLPILPLAAASKYKASF